ncbi:MAG: hypothetical protein SV062_07315 [Thermodesulfobacteriota bacterium]|nr:hypothetical protein [Thermodesulfobacteriota bacterium]
MYLRATEEVPITLVDFDLVNPFYTLRPIKDTLENLGLKVIAWGKNTFMGLGEASSLLRSDMLWALHRKGNIVFDVGYGTYGAEIFNLLEDNAEGRLNIFGVVNICKPLTSTVTGIVKYVKEFGKINGIINNSHWGDKTDITIINEGIIIVSEASKILGVPVISTTVEKKLAEKIGPADFMGNPVWPLTLYMGNAYW